MAYPICTFVSLGIKAFRFFPFSLSLAKKVRGEKKTSPLHYLPYQYLSLSRSRSIYSDIIYAANTAPIMAAGMASVIITARTALPVDSS